MEYLYNMARFKKEIQEAEKFITNNIYLIYKLYIHKLDC